VGIDKLRAITYFVRTKEAGSFAAAARALGVNPSALSKALTALESDIGFALFSRSTRKLVLTEDGKAYAECCIEVLQRLEETELTSRRGLIRPRGTLKFGVHPAVRFALLPRLDGFLAHHPDLKLEMISSNSASALLDKGLDVVLCIGDLPSSNLIATCLGWAQFVICASPTYLARRGVPQDPDSLAAHDAIVYTMPDEEPATRWELQRNGQLRVVTPLMRLAVRDGAGAIDAAINGCGLARPYELAVRPALQSGVLRRVLQDWESPQQPVYAVVSNSRRQPAKVRDFIDFARTLI
jgi:LysR family transcriptional regulator for bpeEF and oprC